MRFELATMKRKAPNDLRTASFKFACHHIE
jgi:hypothetical protein